MKRPATYACLLALALCACGSKEPRPAPKVASKQAQALIMAPGWVAGSGWPAQTVVALNSFNIQQDALVVGDASTILSSPGPWLANDSEGVLGPGAELRGNLKADSVFIREGGRVLGTAAYNQITNRGAIDGAVTTTLALPLAITVPTIANFSAGTTAVDVTAGTTLILASGTRSTVLLRAAVAPATTILRLSGGTYDWQSLNLNERTRVECTAACTIRIKGRISPGERSYIGPAGSSGLPMSAVQVIVEGTNGTAAPDDPQPAAAIGENSELKGYFFVPNGTLHLRENSQSVGKFVAKDVRIGVGADVQDGSSSVVLPQAWITGPSWPNEVVTAYNSVDLGASIQITGDVSVATIATGPVLSTGFEFSLGSNGLVTGNARGDTVIVRTGARVTGSISHNGLTNQGQPPGSVSTPLVMPLLLSVPAFPSYTAGTTTVDVPASADQTRAAGSFGLVRLQAGTAADKTVLTLTGGTYIMADLDLGTHSRLECSAPCEIRVKNRIVSGTNIFVGPTGTLDLANVKVFVQGINGGTGTPTSTPFAAVFGQSGEVRALVFVPNGTLNLGSSINAQGRFVARDVLASGGTLVRSGITITPPVISAQPQSISVVAGQTALFNVTAGGPGITYQWQKNTVNIAGAISNSYTTAATTLADSGSSYRVLVSNPSGVTVTSSAATLTVTPAPVMITTHPQSATVTDGGSVTFTCAASGGGTITWQWRKGTEVIAGATAASYAISPVNLTHAGQYSCEASNGFGTPAVSNPATLTVNLAPAAVVTGPTSANVLEDSPVTFHCVGSGSQIGYRWRKGLTEVVTGATSQDYTIPQVTAEDAGNYYCIVHNSVNEAVSSAATLTVRLNPPSFTTEPGSINVQPGAGFTLSCDAQGTGVNYTWKKDDVDLGVASKTYTVSSAQASHAGSYVCIATNGDGGPTQGGGTITSAAAVVTVSAPGPVITQQPADVQAVLGQPFTLSVTATGALTYQWQRFGLAVQTGSSNTYTKAVTEGSDEGAVYRVVVSNAGGSVTSQEATVHVNDQQPPVLVINNPADSTTASDRVIVTGTATDSGTGVTRVDVANDRIGGQPVGALIDAAGAFNAEVPLLLGLNTLTVTARDARDNLAQQVIRVTVAPTELPRITIATPINGATVQSEPITVSGTVRSSLAANALKISLGTNIVYPSGTGPDYAFSFSGVRLIPGSNLLTVVVESTVGTTSKDVLVTLGEDAPPPADEPPVVTLPITQPDVYVVGDAIEVRGAVSAACAVQSVTVNNLPATLAGSGASVTFVRMLSFAALGSDDVTVTVKARDCHNLEAVRTYRAHKDDGEPELTLDGLQTGSAVNELLQTPYRLTGTIIERNLAGLSVASQSVGALPSGTPGHWTFGVDVALRRQENLTVAVEVWDLAGHRTTREVVLRLNTAFSLDLVVPRNGDSFIVSGATLPLEVSARGIGMAPSDRVLARFDTGTLVELPRAGDTAHGTLNVPGEPGTHTLAVTVVSSTGTLLASRSASLEFIDEATIPLAVVAQTPANEEINVEANSPITLFFNKPIDPTKVKLTVEETVHGKLFVGPPDAADLMALSDIGLTEVSRERDPVEGQAQNMPGNRFAVFYPSEDYGYGGTVFVDVEYENVPLHHARFEVRPLPALVHGFVADHLWVPIEGVEVLLPELGVSATTNKDGNYAFNFGATPEQSIAPGRYRAIINPGNKRQGYGSIERFIQFDPGLTYAGVTSVTSMNPVEPYRHVVSGQATEVVLGSGQLTLDVSQAELRFPDGRSEGDLHVQFLSSEGMSYPAPVSATPDWLLVAQPIGVTVTAQALSVRIALPKRGDSFAYIAELPDRVVLIGLDSRSLELLPIGVARVDRAARELVSEGVLALQRLDAIGMSTRVPLQPALEDYGAGRIDLTVLRAALEAQLE